MNTATLLEEIRKTSIFRQLVPQEAGIGWPIPLRKAMPPDNQKYVFITLPFYGFARTPQSGETALYPPFATLTLDWSNQVPVEYVNLRFRNPWTEGQWSTERVGTFPHSTIAHLSVSQYLERRNELLAMYDVLFNALANDEGLSPEWCTSFSNLLRQLMEPALEPYYRALGPKFFERFLPVQVSAH